MQVLHEVGLELNPGQVLGLVGENGSGKSTTMNILGGVHRPDRGTMTLDGEGYAPRGPKDAAARGIAFIHQELNLFKNLTVEENLFIGGFPKLIGGLPFIDRSKVRARSKELLAAIELDIAPGTPVARLSQGERQLVEIAKALGADARIVIFDEPTTSLTSRESERLFAQIGRLRARGIAVIYISHILGDVMRLCDRITVLRDGHVVGSGPRAEMTIDRLITLMVGRTIDQIYPPREPAARPGTPVLAVSGPQPARRGARTSRSGCSRARSWVWRASWARAARRWPASCSASTPRVPARSRSTARPCPSRPRRLRWIGASLSSPRTGAPRD